MNITVAIPTHNRYDPFLSASIDHLLSQYPSINRYIIVDDDSSDYDKLKNRKHSGGWETVDIYQNEKNLGCYLNKLRCLSFLGEDEWCILLDSDNMLRPEYIESIVREESINGLDTNTAYLPTAALPHFKYDHVSGLLVTPDMFNNHFNVGDAAWNTCNFLLHSSSAKKILEMKETNFDDVLPYNKDACFINFLLANSGCNIKFLEGMQYDHRLHEFNHNYYKEEKEGNAFNEIWDWTIRFAPTVKG